jgi:DNA-binding transcriptional LysR family regulator
VRTNIHNLSSAISVFAAVADTGTFAGAAEHLGMSSPGVSRAISRLEAKLKLRLFHRTTRSVALTDEGRRFYEQVIPHLAGLEEAASAISSDGTSIRGRLRINVDPVVYRFILGERLERFMADHPDLEIEMIARDSLGNLVVDGFDLAVRFGLPRESTLVARKLLDTQIVTVAAPAYLKRWGQPSDPSDLEGPGHRCLEFRNPATGKPFPWEFHRKRKRIIVKPHGQLTVNDPSALMQACVAGLGVAQMLYLIARDMISSGQLVQLLSDWPDERYPLYAYYPSRAHLPARTRAFLDFAAALYRGE